MRKLDVRNLYYITHIDNLPSILEKGILSHEGIEAAGAQFVSMFKGKAGDKNDKSKRSKTKPESNGKNLLHYVSLLFQPRNPMMYRAISEIGKDKLAVLEVASAVLNEPGTIIADGSAVDALTQFYPATQGLKKLQQQGVPVFL